MSKVRSKPVSEGVTLTNGTLFATLYKYNEFNEISESLEDWYYWMPSNASGNIPNTRANTLATVNGIAPFPTRDFALANPPAGYGAVSPVDQFATLKINSYMDLFPVAGGTPADKNASVQRVKNSLDVFHAKGGNAFVLVLRWEEVFKNMEQQDANLDTAWSRYDELVNHAKNKGMKVSFRICVDMDDNTLNVNGTGTAFYGLDNSAKDEWGYPARIEYGFGHCSLNYAAGMAMLYDFVDKVLERYSNILGSQFLWYSVTTTAQQESGYNYENQNYDMGSPGPRYKTGYDHSSHALAAFKAWCQAKYSNNIGALNASWGTSLANFDSITTPKSGLTSPGTTSETPFLNVYKTNKGKDFWLFTYETIKAFQTNCYNKRPAGVKYVLEYGSCSDVMSALRFSCFVSDAANYSDMIKAQFGSLNGFRDLSFSLDVIGSNYPKKKGTEINSADIYRREGQSGSIYGASSIEGMKDIAFQLAKSTIESDGKELVWISDFSDRPIFDALMDVMQQAKAYMDSYTGTTQIVATSNYKLGEVLDSYESVIQRWRSASGDTNRRINFVQSPTIDYSGAGTPSGITFNLYPISQYIISSESIKSINNFQLVNNSVEYNIPNTFYLLVPTHTINYLDEFLARTTIKVVGSNGIEYVRSIQNDGCFVRNNLNTAQRNYIAANYPSAVYAEDGYGNNHPDRRYSGTSGDDGTFILPILPYYDITCENTGTNTVLFDIESGDQTNGGLIMRKNVPVVSGSSDTYRMYTNFMDNQPWWYRGVKINNNRRNV